jgi:hypothetical protein
MIEFSRLGFIGKLFRSRELVELVGLFRLFYEDQPVDYLIVYWMRMRNHEENVYLQPSLFEHVGVMSSLEGKQQMAVDVSARRGMPFAPRLTDKSNKNPSASRYWLSGIEMFRTYSLENCYRGFGYFWGNNPAIGATINVQLKESVMVERIRIVTGHAERPDNVARNAVLQIVEAGDESEGSELGPFVTVAEFRDGTAEVQQLMRRVRAMRIHFLQAQEQWVIVREWQVDVAR